MRELGGLTFIDLRDREGLLQIVVNETFTKPEILKSIGKETVLAVSGRVVKRAKANPDLPSGKVELIANSMEILAASEVPPFVPENRGNVSEELRFKHRYIDLRNLTMQQNFKLRSKVNLLARNFLDKEGFLDIETPMLTNATPEGARDYLVPSRIYKGKMFALPQSPAAVQAAADGGRLRTLLPDHALLPRRGPARRPPARIHPDRHRNELQRT